MIGLQGPSRIINYDEVLQVTRKGQMHRVDGKKVFRNPTIFEITCNVQPVDGRDLLLVPEADRFKEQYFLFTNNLEKPLLEQDLVTRNGANFQVQNVQTWGSFQECRIMRVDVGPEATP